MSNIAVLFKGALCIFPPHYQSFINVEINNTFDKCSKLGTLT